MKLLIDYVDVAVETTDSTEGLTVLGTTVVAHHEGRVTIQADGSHVLGHPFKELARSHLNRALFVQHAQSIEKNVAKSRLHLKLV